MGPFGPLNNKEYTMIKTPKGPIILINPQVPISTKLQALDRATVLRGVGVAEADAGNSENHGLGFRV